MPLAVLAMAFTTFLVISNIIATKIVSLGGWEVSVGFIAYPLTFLVTDTISEVYGRRAVAVVVWAGFVLSLLVVLLIYIGGILPGAPWWMGQQAYDDILGGVPRIVLASMVAYLLSQNNDVILFHVLKKVTKDKHLWLRNNGSTMISQAMDSAVFVSIAFAGTTPGGVLWELIYVQYVLKLGIAVVDTPLVYALVGLVRRIERKASVKAQA